MKLSVVAAKQSTLVNTKWSLKLRSDERKRSVKNGNCEKNGTAKHCSEEDHNFSWDQKLISKTIRKTNHPCKNSNYIDKISYMRPEIWLPSLR